MTRDAEARIATYRTFLKVSIISAAHYSDLIANESGAAEFDPMRDQIVTNLVHLVELIDRWKPRQRERAA